LTDEPGSNLTRDPGKPSGRRTTRRDFIGAFGVLAAAIVTAATGIFTDVPRGPRGRSRPLNKAVTFEQLNGTEDDAAPALRDLLAQGEEIVTIRGRYVLDSDIEIPRQVRKILLTAGSELRIRGDHPGLTRQGRMTFRETTRQPMPTGTTVIGVRAVGAYRVGEHLLLSGRDTVANSTLTYGYLRRVTAVDRESSTIEIDSPLPRPIVKNARTTLVELAPPLWIAGKGRITSTDPAGMYHAIIRFIAAESPRVTGIEVSDSGSTGIVLSHCFGGLVDCTISDLLDDRERHFGYGVNISGSTRNARVLGTISRVRHAVTTNAGQHIPGVGYAGEPENCYFAPRAYDCTNKSIDTHRAGWGITIVPWVTGGAGGVQIRCDNATVVGGSISGCHGPGIFVGSPVTVPARIRDVTITALRGGQSGILAKGPVVVDRATITLTSGTGIEITDGSTVTGGEVGGSADVGLSVTGSYNTVDSLRIGSEVRRKAIEAKPSVRNTISITTQE
jgi:hypothetical protein